MNFWYIFFGIIGLIFILIVILGYPRKKSGRIPSLEGLDDEGVAKAFERMTNFLPFKLLRRKIIKQIKKNKPKGILIDIGCGSGNLIVQIATEFPSLELVGVDISPEILELAKNRAIKNGLVNKIEFKIGSVEKLPFSDHSIDYIISTFSLHHWNDPIKALNEIYRILNQNGIFLIFDFRRNARKFFYGLFTFATKVIVPKALKKINEPLGSIKASYTPQEIIQIYSQTSFQAAEIKPYLAWMFIKGQKTR